MGFNTAVLILNDGAAEITQHSEEFVKKLLTQMMVGGEIGVGGFSNVAQVIRTAHADIHRVYSSHGNWMVELEATKELLERCAKEPRFMEHILNRIRWTNAATRRLRRAINELKGKAPKPKKRK